VELLIVIAIIVILIALLLPALHKARQSSIDISCASNMRQAIMAVFMYNADWKVGLQNYEPGCQYWGQGWVGGIINGPHKLYNPNHVDSEAHDGQANWRGYLMGGHYAPYQVLGCTAFDYNNQNLSATSWMPQNGGFWSYNTVDGIWTTDAYPQETSSGAPSIRAAPPFIWYGAGIYTFDELLSKVGGVIIGGTEYNPSQTKYSTRLPLFACPIVTYYSGGQRFQDLPHRPGYTGLNKAPYNVPFNSGTPSETVSTYKTCSYSGNVGMTDGSVVYVDAPNGLPFKW
jgi:type II secretory pathway pseudopilin PulG